MLDAAKKNIAKGPLPYFLAESPSREEGSGAGEGTRTLDINLGKVALYQLSYTRVAEWA